MISTTPLILFLPVRKKFTTYNNHHLQRPQDSLDSMTEKKAAHSHLPKGLLLPYIVIFRLINSLTISTYFQPDEYWQSLEPAHQFVFGFGHLTWEWKAGLRSFIHPLIFTIPYYISSFLGLEEVGILYLPKITQAIIAGVGEYYLYQFVYNLTKDEIISRWALGLSIASAFNWYIITRTFSNSLELTLTSIALSYWPWDHQQINWGSFNKSLVFATISCLIRPTNGLIWLFLGISLLLNVKDWKTKVSLSLRAMFIGSIIFIINCGIDYLYYGKLTIPLWNFIKFNAISSLSRFYGVAPWHFHIFQSLPIILMLYLPFFMVGLLKYENRLLKALILFIMAIFSTIGHKEFRFLYPIQPFLFLITAYGIFYVNLHHSKLVRFSMIFIIIFNNIIAIFFTQFNERGVIDVISYLRYDPDVYSVGFLTPCHSTPWQSNLHRDDIEAWFLTCEPPLHLLDSVNSTLELEEYKDESDLFYEDPRLFLFQNFPPPFNKDLRSPGKIYHREWPTHLVFFEKLEPFIKDYLKDSPYQECKRFFNSYFHWDDRRTGDVIVYCKWPWE